MFYIDLQSRPVSRFREIASRWTVAAGMGIILYEARGLSIIAGKPEARVRS